MKTRLLLPALLAAVASVAQAQWRPLGTNYWNVLLHLGADFNNDYLYSRDNNTINADQLAVYGGQTSQTPYAGLTYQNLEGPTAGVYKNFTWTILTNAAASGAWTPTPNRDNYIKYWQAYLWVFGDHGANVTVRFRSDDDLRIWDNGVLIAETGYTTADKTSDIALLPGFHRITIKLREGSGGDYMALRMTARGSNDAASGVFFGLDPSSEPLPAPQLLSMTHARVELAACFGLDVGTVDFFAVCDTQDWGRELADWLAADTRVQVFEGIAAPPASIIFSNLAANTSYIFRCFATNAAGTIASGPLAVTTYGKSPVIAALAPSDVAGLSATANAQILFTGSDSETVDLTLYWGTDTNSWNTPIVQAGLSAGLIAFPLSNLWYSTTYYYQFHAVNPHGDAWSEVVPFTTLGQPIFGPVSATIAAPGALDLAAQIVESGPAAATVTCYLGPADGDLAAVQTWTGVTGPTNLVHTVGGLQVGGNYRYAFSIYCHVDSATEWTVWSPTNIIAAAGDTTWTAGAGADTDWHTAANWDYGVPGPAARANFYKAGATVTAIDDLAVAQASVNAAGSMTFNLGDAALHVHERFDVGGNATPGYPAATDIDFVLKGGTLDIGAGSFNLSTATGRNTMTLADGATLRAATINFVCGQNLAASIFNVLGARTRLIATNFNYGAVSKYNDNLLRVEDALFVIAQNFAIGKGEDNRNKAVFRNADVTVGGTVVMSAGWSSNDDMLIVAEGTVFSANAITTGGQASQRNFIIVSNAILNVARDIGISRGNSQAHDHRLVIAQDPGKTSIVTVGGNIDIGTGGMKSSRVVIGNGTLDVNGSINLYNATDLGIALTNGTLRAGAINLGYNGGSGAYLTVSGQNALLQAGTINLGYGNTGSRSKSFTVDGGTAIVTTALNLGGNNTPTNRLHIAGRTARVSTPALTAKAASTLAFVIPDDGFADVPVQIAGSLSIADDTTIEVAADNFTGVATLVQSSRDIPVISENAFVFILRPSRRARVIYDDPTSLKVKISPEATLLLIR